MAFFKIIFKSDYPKFLVLEYGADKSKDIDYLLQIISPSIGVFVSSSDMPVHVEFYSCPEEVAEEDAKIILALPEKGFAILNFDDKTVLSSRNLTKAKVLTYGFNKGADVRIAGFKNRCQGHNPSGIIFKLQYQKQSATIKIDGVFGKGQAYATAASAAVGLILGFTLKEMADIFPFYQSLPGRLKLIKGIKSCYLIDDSYNASPSSTKEALDVLRDLKAKRKVAILGDMLELGEYSVKAHENIGKLVADFVDVLITVGPKAEFIAKGARKTGFPKKNISGCPLVAGCPLVISFSNSDEAKTNIEKIIKPDDLILIKGSQGSRMEKISFKIMAEPAKAAQLLPRQYGKWLK